MAEQHSSKGIMIATIVVAIVLTAIVVPFSMKAEKSAADASSAPTTPRDLGPPSGRERDGVASYIRSIIAWPKAEHFTSLALSIRRAKS